MRAILSLIAALTLCLSSATAISQPVGDDLGMLVRLHCGAKRGTGTRLSDSIVITAAHVTGESMTCLAGAGGTVLATVTHSDPALDFAVLEIPVPGSGRWTISCREPQFMERLEAYGFARGTLTVMTLTASGLRRGEPSFHGDFAMLSGAETVQPGMSGGPVLDASGRLVAIVAAYDPAAGISYVRLLRDTPLCR